MKVLYIVNIPSPYRVAFFNELSQYCGLTVLYERKNAVGRQWTYNDSIYYKEIYLKGIELGEDSSLCLSSINFLRKNKKEYDIIVVGGYGTYTGMIIIDYLRLNKIPFILNCDGGMENHANIVKRFIKRHYISSASSYLSPAKVTDDFLIKYGAKKENIYRYPFTSVYKSEVLQSPIGIEEKRNIRQELEMKSKFIIVSVGRIMHLKGFDVLIKACYDISDLVEVYIVGGSLNYELEKIILETGANNIHFINFQKHDKLLKYYKAADAFVFSTRGDVWGLVVNEAMSNGLPVISSNKAVAGLELVKENGYIYEVEEINQLKDCILSLIRDQNKTKMMAQKSLEIIREYTIENMAKIHMKIFEKILSRR